MSFVVPRLWTFDEGVEEQGLVKLDFTGRVIPDGPLGRGEGHVETQRGARRGARRDPLKKVETKIKGTALMRCPDI